MDKLFFETELLNSLALIVIDIENKTNEEIKKEVRVKVRRALNTSKQKALAGITRKEEHRAIYAQLTKLCKKEYDNIMAQYDIQIDQMVPPNSVNSSVESRIAVKA